MKSKILKIVSHLKRYYYPKTTAKINQFVEQQYLGEYEGKKFELLVYPKEDRGWVLKRQGVEIANRDSNHPINVLVDDLNFKYLMQGKEFLLEEIIKVNQQIRDLQEQRHRFENLYQFGIRK